MFRAFKKIILGDEDEKRPAADDELPLAICTLLLEAAHADDHFHPREEARLEQIVRERFSLSPEASAALLERARRQSAENIDLYPLTNLINQHYQTEEKCRLLEQVWQVVYADGVLDQYEDHLMHKLATLLQLSHRQLIDAKLQAKAATAEKPARRSDLGPGDVKTEKMAKEATDEPPL